MGCGSSSPNDTADTSAPAPNTGRKSDAGLQLEEFWVAGSVQCMDRGVPAKGPFREEIVPPQPPKHRILFSDNAIGRVVKADYKGLTQFPGSGPNYARAFFPHCLPCYCVGWAKLELSQEHPHYNCKKQREREKEKERLGVAIDYSRRKKYFIYPERVSEIGLFLWVDNKKQETNVAGSNTTWPADVIQGAFFTFSPDHGSVFGENSLQIPMHPRADDPLLEDKRWLLASIEYNKMVCRLSCGSHEVKCEVRYRYGNTKFTAWRGTDTDKGVYRYSDEDRTEAAVSETVATGNFTLKITADDQKKCKANIETCEAKLAALIEKERNS